MFFCYCFKSLRENCAPEEYQEIDVDKISITFSWNFIKSIKKVHELRVAGVSCYSNWLDAKMCIRLKNIITFQNGKQKWLVKKLYALRQKVEKFVEDNLLESDVKLGRWKCSGTVSIDLC